MAIKEVEIISKIIPRGNENVTHRIINQIINGGGGTSGSVDHAKSAYTLDDNTPVLNWFISKVRDEDIDNILNFLSGLKINGDLVSKILKSDSSVTDAKDTDIMSARKILELFNGLSELYLSRVHNDTAQGLITFLKGIVIGNDSGIDEKGVATLSKVLADTITSKAFVKGQGGKGFGAYLDNLKKSHFESDYLLTRIKAIIAEAVINILTSKDITCEKLTVTKQAHFFKLIIDEIKAAGGQIVLSYADCTAEKVVRQTNGNYRVYWTCKNEKTGKAILNKWQVNDQALCQTFNAAEGVSYNVSNKYYWRLVVSAGRQTLDGTEYNYIELSNTVKDGSSVPEANDEIAGLGYRGADDEARQSAIILSAYASPDRNVKAPAIVQYRGINSFSFDGCVMNQFSANGNIIRGQLHVESGKAVETAIKDGVESIMIGGRNLLLNSGQIRINGGMSLGSDYIPGQQYTISIVMSTLISAGSNPGVKMLLYCPGVSPSPLSIFIPISDKRQIFTFTYPQEGLGSLNLCATESWAGTTDITKIKIEIGNKATDWTPAPEDVEAGIAFEISKVRTDFDIREGQISAKVAETQSYAQNASASATAAGNSATSASASANTAGDKANAANASAIAAGKSATNAKGSADAAKSSEDKAKNSADAAAAKLVLITQKETSINQTADAINLKASQVEDSVTTAQMAAILASAMSKGKMLYRDPTFTKGFNGINSYWTNPITRETGIVDNPNGSTAYSLKIDFLASTNANKGGFRFTTQSRANAVFVVRFVGLFPAHVIIKFGTNATGDNGSKYWLTPNKGTGKYEEYAYYVRCGATGEFSTTNFFYISSDVTSAFFGRLCYATVFDMTDADDVPLRSEMSAELNILANQISSKVSQADYDNNNNVINSRFSLMEQNADSITLRVSSVENDFDNLSVGGRNLLRNSNNLITSVSYQIAQYNLASIPVENQVYTISIKGILGNDRDQFAIYNSGWKVALCSLRSTNLKNGVYSKTFVWKNTSGENTVVPTYLKIFNNPSSGTSSSTIEWVKLEAGNKATDWTPAPEDQASYVDTRSEEAKNAALADAAAKYTLKTVYESQIQQLSNEISLKVSSATFNALGQRVTASEGKIEILEGKVALTVTNAELQEALGLVNQEGRNYYALSSTSSSTGNFIRRTFKLEKNTAYTVRTTVPRPGAGVMDVWAAAGQTIAEDSSKNGVAPDAPRIVTTDKNGYITVSFRKTHEEKVNKGEYKIWVAKGDAVWRPAIEDQDYFAQLYATTSQANAIAEAQDMYDKIKVGGRNILRSSNDGVNNSVQYLLKRYNLAFAPSEGQTYTISIKGNLGSDRKSFGIYNSGGSVELIRLTPKMKSNGVYTGTFEWTNKNADGSVTVTPTYINIYQFQNSGTSASTIEWIKLEAGNKATDWSIAYEDVSAQILNLGNEIALMVPYTVYDGDVARIKTCGIDIKAGKITMVGDITANGNVHINTDGTIKAVNAEVSGKITATSGKIGGMDIHENYIGVPQNNIGITLSPSGIAAYSYYNNPNQFVGSGLASDGRIWSSGSITSLEINARGKVHSNGGYEVGGQEGITTVFEINGKTIGIVGGIIVKYQ